MKQKTDSKSKKTEKGQHGMKTAAMVRRERRAAGWQRMLRIILIVVMLGTLVVFGWIADVGSGLGWITMARAGENWPMQFVQYGQFMIFSSILLTMSAVLCLLRKNWISMVVGTVGIVLCFWVLYQVMRYAADAGFYSNIWQMPVHEMYRNYITPTAATYVALMALCCMDQFSYAGKVRREQKRQKSEQEAPHIL